MTEISQAGSFWEAEPEETLVPTLSGGLRAPPSAARRGSCNRETLA